MPHSCHAATVLRAPRVVEIARRPVVVRVVGPADAARFQAFVRGLSRESRHNRFLSGLHELPDGLLAWLTRAPDATQHGFVALDPSGTIVGEGRFGADDTAGSCEIGLAVTDAWQGRGLGRELLACALAAARASGFHTVRAEMLRENARALRLLRAAGFVLASCAADARLLLATMPLAPADPATAAGLAAGAGRPLPPVPLAANDALHATR